MTEVSYNLNIVVNWLNDHRIVFDYSSNGFVETGCIISINNHYKLSVQTDPSIAGSSFAETALISIKHQKIIYNIAGYVFVKRYRSPNALFGEVKRLILLNPVESS